MIRRIGPKEGLAEALGQRRVRPSQEQRRLGWIEMRVILGRKPLGGHDLQAVKRLGVEGALRRLDLLQ